MAKLIITEEEYIINARFIKEMWVEKYNRGTYCVMCALNEGGARRILAGVNKDEAKLLMKEIAVAIASDDSKIIDICAQDIHQR